jgi:FemAB-related protein (PEP-CTERM system-associated)
MNAVSAIMPGELAVRHDASDAAIEAFLATQADATPFHTPRWGRAAERATGHRWIPLSTHDALGTMTGFLPVHHIRSRLFGNALISSGFAVSGGIIAQDYGSQQMLVDAVTKMAAQQSVPSIELKGGSAPTGWAVDTDTYLGFIRPLAADDDAELLAIPRKHRAEVRKALANGLDVAVGSGKADRDAHFAAYATSVRNLGTPVFPRALFDAVLDAFGDDADILTIRHSGTVVASVLSLYWRGTVMPYWGGGTQAARGLRANELMYFALMRHARTRGCTHFDFGRSKAGTGPAAYKKNWGFEQQPLSYTRWTADGAPPRDTNPTSAKYRFMVESWQRLPLWLANRVGPFIARQLG